jgi:predicted N-formylglutamate amidohydrolase
MISKKILNDSAGTFDLLLGPDDPPPFERVNPDGRSPLLLLCDHASNTVPQRLQSLGIDPQVLQTSHIAWDIGAACVTRGLAGRLKAPAVLAGYSRLVIDCNRQPGDPTSIPPLSDNIPIPGNRDLTDNEAELRAETLFWPYHHAITQDIAQLWRHGPPPAIIAVHSFTPVFNGLRRPWDIGLLWNHDPRIMQPLLRRLERYHSELCIGDNQPYSGRDFGFTVEHHAAAAGLPHIGLEIRQDLIADGAGCQRWVTILAGALEAILSNESLHQVENF